MSAAARSHIHGTDAREDWQEEEPSSIHRVGTGGGDSGQHVYATTGKRYALVCLCVSGLHQVADE